MSSTPICLSPALPSELLSYVLSYHAYPTTLIICSSQSDFVSSAIQDLRRQEQEPEPEPGGRSPTQAAASEENILVDDNGNGNSTSKDHSHSHKPPQTSRSCALLSSPLHQVATSRHIRVVYAPSVTHLRACLSAPSFFFPPSSRVVPAPPSPSARAPAPALLVYGFLALHRGTSEWSAQGLGNTASALVELAHRLGWRAVLVEPLLGGGQEEEEEEEAAAAVSGRGRGRGRGGRRDARLAHLLEETAPILSGGVRRKMGPGAGPGEAGAWAGRTVEVGRVLGRWFAFQHGPWDEEEEGEGEGEGEGDG
ncbi:hypothetical protein F5X96DRAFT_89511 [Biscogniauxia mediterranea]|nr:hypothetical protein F5X96DRAFT_89511 [Biscogniauxia mediterranea]